MRSVFYSFQPEVVATLQPDDVVVVATLQPDDVVVVATLQTDDVVVLLW